MNKTKLILSTLLVFTMCIMACGFNGSAQRKQETPETQTAPDKQQAAEKQVSLKSDKTEWLDYWPAVVELEGKLDIKTIFGPPNFGENPETDSKERSWILSLSKPINVLGKTDDPDLGLSTSVENVRILQLVLPKSHKELIGKKVIVKGTLFHAHTGHHHTDVLMDVQSIEGVVK